MGEQAPDAAVYMEYGHWRFSLKNPYYDLINVASFWIAVLHEVYGIGDVVNAVPNLVFYIVIILLFICSLLIAYRRLIGGERGFDVVVYALLIAIASPYITFISVPPSLSALYALLFIGFFISRDRLDSRDYVVLLILALAGILTHATAMGMIIFFLLSLTLILRIVKNKTQETHSRGTFGVLVTVLVLYVLLSLVRFIYTTAYISLYPYYASFISFINFLSGTGEVELRASKYGLYAPLFTVFSWTILPGLAASYVLYCLIKRSCTESRQQLISLSLLIGGLILIGMGFIGSHFSNSFSREAGYPGYMLLLLGSIEPLRLITKSRRLETMLMVVMVLGLISGIYTVTNAAGLYIGKLPFLAFRPPTPGEALLIRQLINTGVLNTQATGNIMICTQFDPNTILVYALLDHITTPSDVALGKFIINAVPLNSCDNITSILLISSKSLLMVTKLK
ncbi:MAG: hypothetical protein ACP5NQ_09600 [Vulcanisaeta sp.]